METGSGGPIAGSPLFFSGRPERGFTLIELITIIVILGIIAVVALPRLGDRYGMDERGLSDQMQAALRYAQKIVVAQRRNVCVQVNPNAATALALNYVAAGTSCAPPGAPVELPGGGGPYTVPRPNAVVVAGASFQLDSAVGGGPITGLQQTLLVGNRPLCIERITGYVYERPATQPAC